jgi:hypothetical protein
MLGNDSWRNRTQDKKSRYVLANIFSDFVLLRLTLAGAVDDSRFLAVFRVGAAEQRAFSPPQAPLHRGIVAEVIPSQRPSETSWWILILMLYVNHLNA